MTTQANITPDQAAAMLAAEAAPAANDNAAEVAASAPPSTPPSQAEGEAEHKHEVHMTDKEEAALADKPFALQKASEKKLAVFLHQHLSPILSNGLSVDVHSNLDNWPIGNAPVMMDLHIDVMGDNVHNKAEELWARTTEELKKHPAFAGLEIGGGYESKGPDNDPQPEQTIANMNKLHMVVKGIPVDRFKQLLETLAEVKPAPAPTQHADKPDHQCSGAGCSQCAAPAAESPAVAQTAPDVAASAQAPAPADAPQTHPAAAVAAEAQASGAQAVADGVPVPQVAGVNRLGMTNDTSVAPPQTALG